MLDYSSMVRQQHFYCSPFLFNPLSALYKIAKHLGYALGSVTTGIQFYLDLARIYLSSFFILSVCSVHCGGNVWGGEGGMHEKASLKFFLPTTLMSV